MSRIVVQKFKMNCLTVPIPPGLGDFLRGSIALYKMSKMLDFKLVIDFDDHPCSNFIKKIETIDTSDLYHMEYFNTTFDYVYNSINEQFKYNNIICLVTSIFYSDFENILDTESRDFIQCYFTPIKVINDNIEQIKKDKQLDNNFKVIQIRTGDREIVSKNKDKIEYAHTNKIVDNSIVSSTKNLLDSLYDNNTIIISDSLELKKYLNFNYNYKVSDSNPVHFGTMTTLESSMNEKYILETLNDFFLMSHAKEIISLSIFNSDGSGFSKLCSKIYNLQYSSYYIYI